MQNKQEASPSDALSVGRKEFLKRAREGDIEFVKRYLNKNRMNPAAISVINDLSLLRCKHLNVHLALLEEKSCSTNLINDAGETRLTYAVHPLGPINYGWGRKEQLSNRKAFFDALLAKPDIDARTGKDENGRTILQWAQMLVRQEGKDYLTFVKDLLRMPGIQLDNVDDDGDTALMVAVEDEAISIIEMLLDKGANPCLKNKKQKSAREMTDNRGIEKILLEAELKMRGITKLSTRERMKKDPGIYGEKEFEEASKKMQQGDEYFESKNYESAAAQYIYCVEVARHAGKAHNQLGWCFFYGAKAKTVWVPNKDKLSQFDLAAFCFRGVLRLVPDFNDAQYNPHNPQSQDMHLCPIEVYINAINGLLECIKKGATINEIDLVNTPFEDQPLETIDREELQNALLRRLSNLDPKRVNVITEIAPVTPTTQGNLAVVPSSLPTLSSDVTPTDIKNPSSVTGPMNQERAEEQPAKAVSNGCGFFDTRAKVAVGIAASVATSLALAAVYTIS